MIATATQELVTIRGDLEAAELRVLRAILESNTWSRPVATLERIAGLCAGLDFGCRVIDGLVAESWVVRWTPPPEEVIEPHPRTGKMVPRAVSRPAEATLSPLGADWLGVTLIQPAQDGARAEPRWGWANDDLFDLTGRHPNEPDHFTIEEDWGHFKRAKTTADRIIAAREKHKGHVKRQSDRRRAG